MTHETQDLYEDLRRIAEDDGKPKRPKKTFKDVNVLNDVNTKSIILPEGMSSPEARDWLAKHEKQMETEVSLRRVVNAFPMDGAVALARTLKDVYGWSDVVPIPSWFGSTPPMMVSVEIGPGLSTGVHWGRYTIPGLEGGFLETGFHRDGNRLLFCLSGCIKRKFESNIRQLMALVEERVEKDSIYRGKAVRVNYRDEDGDLKEFTPDDCPKFIDTDPINPEELIFPGETQSLVEVALYSVIERSGLCRKFKIPLKRGVMLEGPYGVGKTLCANVLAKKCVEHGWTYIYVSDVRDLAQALQLAEMYQPAVVFGEDVDRIIGAERSTEVDNVLNVLDGVGRKNMELITVLTTNNVHGIHPAMVRPGRIDTVVPVRPPDASAAVRLIRVYGKDKVRATDEQLESALKPVLDLGSNAAVYREIVERAKLNAVCHMGDDDEDIIVETQDIGLAAKTMHQHLMLLNPPAKESPSAFELFGRALADMSAEKVHQSILEGVSENAETIGETIAANT